MGKSRTTICGLHCFSYFSAKQWNALPDELRNSTFIFTSFSDLNFFS